MKQIIKITLSLLFIAASFTSCVDDKDFDTPQVSCDDTKINAIPSSSITTFQNVIASYTGSVVTLASPTGDKLYLEGYVVSSDLKANFYKELYIQNKKENPTYAIKIAINDRGLYSKYPIGSKIMVKLNGLVINKDHGVITIGELVENEFSSIRSSVAKTNILRKCGIETIVPIDIMSSLDVTSQLSSKFVRLQNVQFSVSELNSKYTNSNDDYDSHKMLVFCSDESTFKLETSPFASFKDLMIPSKKFDVSGILTRNYGDDFFVLKINGIDDIITNNDERCGVALLNCDNNANGGSEIIFQEDFSSISSSFPNWTNINVNGGNTKFTLKTYSGNKFAECSPYGSNENPLESWLVTPAINLDSTNNEVLTFDTMAHHDSGVALSVYISTDFIGDVSTATWNYIPAIIGASPSSTYGDYINSGVIDISCFDGDVYVAFKYLGGGSIETGMQVDNIKVTGSN